MKTWHWLALVAAVIVFFVPFGSNLGGSPPTTLWQDIKSGKLHLPHA